MALQAVDNLLQQARKASDEDLEKLCNNILDLFQPADKTAECTNLLRQLFFILQAGDHPMSIPKQLLEQLISYSGLLNDKNAKQCLLCQRIIKEVMPLDAPDVSDYLQPVSNSTVNKNLLPLYITQGRRYGCIKSVLSSVMRWLSSQDIDFESQRHGFVFLVAVSVLHSNSLSTDYIQTTSNQISQWLLNASVQQAPNPYTINPFRKDQTAVVNEVDGTPSQNFFTLLNIGQYYTEDQFLNIYSFSLLYKWLYHCHQRLQVNSDDNSGSKCQKVFSSLASKSVDYCFRVLDQCERKPKAASDAELQIACLYEATSILDLICTIENSYIPKVHQEIKRLYSRIYQDINNIPIIIKILQFFINHSKAVVHDPHETYSYVFTHILATNFSDQGLMFDIVNFLLTNLETLCFNTSVLSTYFPNIFKIIAWHPRTFLSEFIDILPALMSSSTSLEIFHTILDLPCMTAALEVINKSTDSIAALSTSTAAPSSSSEAYQMALYRPLFTFITRVEGGHGDTINRLDSLHGMLDDMKSHARVTVASQIVPILLRVWFSEILENGGYDFAVQLLPVLLERSILLYPKPSFVVDVKRILSENLVKMLKKYKSIVISQYEEISDFLISTRNIFNREEFYTNLVWCVGEFCSEQHSQLCSADLIAKYYSVLEAVTYETSGLLLNSDSTMSDITPKTVSVLISALCKLATRCQDLVPRAILSLTKVTKQHISNTKDREGSEMLITRCQELVNILKLPNFASAILNPPEDIDSGRWHKDSTSFPVILRATYRQLSVDT